MKKRWDKGKTVNIAEFLKIAPVANEIVQLSDELNIDALDLLWIVSQIIDNNPEKTEQVWAEESETQIDLLQEEWDEAEADFQEEDTDKILCTVKVNVYSNGRFPEVGFKAGITNREDINYFFDLVMGILDKLDSA